MNEIVNTFLLAGEKFMCETHLIQLYLHIVLVDHLLKIKKEQKKKKIKRLIKKINKQEIQDIFIKTN